MPFDHAADRLDLGKVPAGWAALDRLERQVQQLDDQPPRRDLVLTARTLDEAQPGGPRVYIGASAHLGNAMEHLHTLQTLLEHHGVTPRAPWTLMRPVFESAFWAVWLLEPDDGRIRRQRALRLEVLDLKERGKYFAAFRMPSEHRERIAERERARQAIYRAEADAIGLDWSRAGQKPSVVGELVKLSAVKNLGGVGGSVVGVWRSLSGIQHGHPYAVLANSDVTATVPIPGGSADTVTINDDAFQVVGMVTNYLLLAAFELMVSRSTRPPAPLTG